MKTRSSLAARLAAATTTIGVALAGAVVLSSGATQAVLQETNYGMLGTAYGTKVTAKQVKLRSGPTAYAWIACTRLAGKQKEEHILQVKERNTGLEIGAVDSYTETIKDVANDVAAGVRSRNSVGHIALGPDGGPQIVLDGLTSTSTAWVDNNGEFHTATRIRTASISSVGLEPVTEPIQDLLDAIDTGLIREVLKVINSVSPSNDGQGLEIPGVMTLYANGWTRESITATNAQAATKVLRVVLHGPDGDRTTKKDNSEVVIGRTWARVTKGFPAAVMLGRGWGAEVTVADGLVSTGRLGIQRLPCRGTNGKVRKNPTAGVDLGNSGMVQLGAIKGTAAGDQERDGSAWARTTGRIAGIYLSDGDQSLEIKGITGVVNVNKTSRHAFSTNFNGSTVAEILVNGESQGGFNYDPAECDNADGSFCQALDIPGLARVEIFSTSELKGGKGGEISVIRIVLLEGAQEQLGISEIRLGNAKAKIKRY